MSLGSCTVVYGLPSPNSFPSGRAIRVLQIIGLQESIANEEEILLVSRLRQTTKPIQARVVTVSVQGNDKAGMKLCLVSNENHIQILMIR